MRVRRTLGSRTHHVGTSVFSHPYPALYVATDLPICGLAICISHTWHTASIQLAGCIWDDCEHRTSCMHPTRELSLRGWIYQTAYPTIPHSHAFLRHSLTYSSLPPPLLYLLPPSEIPNGLPYNILQLRDSSFPHNGRRGCVSPKLY